ncbi:MAG: YceD family protein [Halanaerobiaceae bacterium]
MDIDLSRLEELGNKLEIDSKLDFENLKYQNRLIKIPEPLNLNIVVYKGDQSFIFTGEITGQISLECSRCLEFFLLDIEVEVDKEVSPEDIEDLKHFDLKQLLQPDLYLAVPIKPLCSDDCEGICPHCGQNLNEGQCDCTTEDVDPRMAKLKDFYNEES